MSRLIDWTNATPERRRAYEQERLIADVTETIHELMAQMNVTKADLAKALGTSKSNVTQLFSGNRNVTLRTLSIFASAMGMRVSVSFVPASGPEPIISDNPSCWDCPPVGHPTDKTRCAECPRMETSLTPAEEESLRERSVQLEQHRDGFDIEITVAAASAPETKSGECDGR